MANKRLKKEDFVIRFVDYDWELRVCSKMKSYYFDDRSCGAWDDKRSHQIAGVPTEDTSGLSPKLSLLGLFSLPPQR